jgi:hypothetical protein
LPKGNSALFALRAFNFARELGQIEGAPHLAQINGAHFIDKVLLFLSSFASKTPPSLFARTAISGILGLTI